MQKCAKRVAAWQHAGDVSEWVAVVTHADLVKMIVAHYVGIVLAHVLLINVDTASAPLFTFHLNSKLPPSLLCFNWTLPAVWLAALKSE
ncbi:MAG: hypothetical protein ACXWQR_13670 [Ktedonobacterales bacterium]